MRRIGWICFAAMWAPFVGMVGLPQGSYDWSELPVLTRASLLGVGFFFIASMALLLGSSVVNSLQNRAVRKVGRPARAEVLEIWATGTTINQNPVVRLRLEVRPKGEPPFQAETEELVSRLELGKLQPGSIVKVMVDPEDDDVALLGF
jgi:hypothetical protein